MSDLETPQPSERIAVIGMAGRFPGARNLSEFWQNLVNGRESLVFFSEHELLSSGVDPALLRNPHYVRAGIILEDAELFDASFFGFHPREAEAMDPQHRFFLECAWEALEDAGYDAKTYPGSISIYAGAGGNSYLINNLYSSRRYLESLDRFHLNLLNDKDFLATRASYKLGLKGPSVTVQTACSTSLVAVHQACMSLLNYQCDIALAGGVAIRSPQREGYLYQEGMIFSPDGHCRAFDAKAQGTVAGSGVGIVVLKRLEDAIAQGDRIDAVISGSATNNDGSMKVGYTAPSVDGQAEVIAMAQAMADVEPDTVTYVEAHGTGTALGDPIEIAALTQAFRDLIQRKGFCAIGSVKTNIGHAGAAAGVAGLIKTVLALKHKLLPPSLHFEQANPQIDFANSPFYVNTQLAEWHAGPTPRRAGVSSFGMGGTNAHVILEEAPAVEPSGESRSAQLLVLSARTSAALDTATTQLAEHLRNSTQLELADAAYTLQVGRRAFSHRRILVCRDRKDAAEALKGLDPKRVITSAHQSPSPAIVFMFPGQGSQCVNMGLDLYQEEAGFREQVDLCSELLEPHLGLDLRGVLYPSAEQEAAAVQQLRQTAITQPALFVVEYALAFMWMEWGVRPHAMIGHSIGEYVAACLAGVFSLEDVLSLLAARGRLIQQLPAGSMLAVRLPEEELLPLLTEGLSLAAVNGPSLCVVSGPTETIDLLQSQLAERGVACRPLNTSHAFHSQMMEPILGPFTELVSKLERNPPQIPCVSNVTGTQMSAEAAIDPSYWAKHLRQTVRFTEGLNELLKEPVQVLLEVGPGHTLSTAARQLLGKGTEQLVLSSLDHPSEQGQDVESVLSALGRLWLAGVEVDWSRFHAHHRRRRVPLPTYPFERKRYWVLPSQPMHSTHTCITAVEECLLPPLSPSRQDEPTGTGGTACAQTMTGARVITASDARRQERILSVLQAALSELSGVDIAELDTSATFLEMGFDSLFLTQVSQVFGDRLRIHITLRQLLEQTPTLDALATHCDQVLPPEADLPGQAASDSLREPAVVSKSTSSLSGTDGSEAGLPADQPSVLRSSLERIMAQQLQVMAQQLDLLRKAELTTESLPTGESMPSGPLNLTKHVSEATPEASSSQSPPLAQPDAGPSQLQPGPDLPVPFGPYSPIKRGPADGLTPRQQQHLDGLIARYTARTQASKQLTQACRPYLADPRAVGGFRLLWKEMVYPIITERSSGSKVWDLDGNEYVDLTMGFGATLFGHTPIFLRDALQEQLQRGMEIGPQSPLAGKVADLLCKLTGVERVTFCNTGSEAVMAALRVARTVTGRTKFAMFAGSYHGNFDAVLVRPIGMNRDSRAVPIAPGIPRHLADDVLVLDYGCQESLQALRSHAHELAAVLVEPVQSRRPDLQPGSFLKDLRQLTKDSGVALIFDEVITGFRLCPGGAQEFFDIRADLVTYGKVVAGGMPIGVLAGKATYMDALDGGMWNYGDTSLPEAGVTFLAGTFIRHPLALAAACAVLNQLKDQGPDLQKELNGKTWQLSETLNAHFEQHQIPIRILSCGSMFAFRFESDVKHPGLFFFHLRDRGIHAWQGRPCFLSTAHTGEDVDRVIEAVKEIVAEMKDGEFLPQAPPHSPSSDPLLPRQSNGAVTDADSPSPGTSTESISLPLPSQDGVDDTHPVATLPLTEAQREIWIACQMGDEASCAYNQCITIHLRGSLQREAMQHAIQQLVDRHEALRTTFDPRGEHQETHGALRIESPLLDYSALNDRERQARIEVLLAAEVQEPFNLAKGPLLRLRFIRCEDQYHVLVLTIHHIVCDGWSLGVVLRELGALYSSERQGTICQLASPMQFSEYSKWLMIHQNTPEGEASESYWLSQFKDSVPVLELPTDRPRPLVKTYNASQESVTIDKTLCSSLRQVSAQHGCTLFSTLFAAFEVLLYRLTGQDDLVVGIPAAGQMLFGGSDLVGHCTNLLPLRCLTEGTRRFADRLPSIQSVVLGAYEHGTCTLGGIVSRLQLRRDPSRFPLVDAIFNVDRQSKGLTFHGLEVEMGGSPKRYTTFDVFFNLAQMADQIDVCCIYNRDLFDATTIQRWLGHFHTLLKSIIADPSQPVDRLAVLSEAERQQLLVAWNDTQAAYPQDRCIHQLFEAQVERTPNAIAVVFGSARLTYRELNRRANQLAHHLRSLGVGPEVLVGLCVERSLEMVVGLLGILKAGGAYVPLDPAYPEERLAFMCKDARMPVVVTQERLLSQLPENAGHVVCLDTEWETIMQAGGENPASGIGPDDLAYVIYTSGSTGRPKGVQIPHRAVVNFLNCMGQELGITEEDVLLAVTTLSFDIAVLELLLPLTVGARVVGVSREIAADGAQLSEHLRRSGATVMQATPATWRLLLEAGWQGNQQLRIVCGGEALPRELAQQLLERGASLWNLYGPTETTIWSTVYKVEPGEDAVPIGRPIANTRIYLLDRHMQPVPIGVPGELHIGGIGLARGYLNRSKLTAEKFIADPFSEEPGERLYKTGDLARILPDGSIEFLGRIDHQVKIRGFRIELGEVEAVLSKHPAVREAIVVAREDEPGDQRLVAYLVAEAEQAPTAGELRMFLKEKLPDYMVPSAFVMMDALPLTPNGKVDRRALPEPSAARPDLDESFTAPRSPVEEDLARIWADILGLERVGIRDNFFELGGHSLRATQLISRLRDDFQVKLPLRSVFEAPTVASLAEHIETIHWAAQGMQPSASVMRVDREEGYV